MMNNYKAFTCWDQCCLCQKETQEKLTQPNFKNKNNGYKTLQTKIEILQSICLAISNKSNKT